MGKRSNFERREADFYPTPRAAVVPLVPRLRGIKTFAEPCAGEGDLVRHLEEFGLQCVYAGDIRDGLDALERDDYGAADVIVTNPPWSRDPMHRLIAHFQNIRQTWLLLDADWAHTKQAAPFLPHASDIVAVGRVKWIENSKYTGKDNCAWYRFDIKHKAGPVFHGRDQGTDGSIQTLKRRPGQCGKAYEQWQRSSSRFCSPHVSNRLIAKIRVTPTVTAIIGTVSVRRHADVQVRGGSWVHCPPSMAHHGEYSVLMRRSNRMTEGLFLIG
jgi:hypothetical protein